MSILKEPSDLTLTQAVDYAVTFKEVPLNQFFSRKRDRELVFARALASYLMLYAGHSVGTIARHIGRDHSSVCHYRSMFLNDLDFMLKYNLKNFRIFLHDRGVFLPSIIQFREKVKPRERNYE